MGTWSIVAGLCLGATVVTYDGAPDHPGPDRISRLIDKHRVSVFALRHLSFA